MGKRIISAAITGSIHTPSMSPYLPITPEEIAQNAIDAAKAGAASVHIHARNPETGRPSPDLDIFQEIIDMIREVDKDVIICLTTGGSLEMTIEERAQVIPRFKPELASMNAGSINWGLFPAVKGIKEFKTDWEEEVLGARDVIFQNTFADMDYMLKTMKENGTKPELEVYDVGHLYNIKFMIDEGWITEKPFIQFVMGINGAIGASPYDLQTLKETADRLLGVGNYEWSAFGAGRHEFPITLQNLFLGGHVRVGLEDNLYLKKGVLAKNNAELVTKMANFMDELGYEIATPDEAREILGIK